MEKRFKNKIKKIVLTGAESTGKSTLTMQLADYYNTKFISEFAREFVENLRRQYKYKDIEYIAKQHIKNINEALIDTNEYLFIDTYLIIIKIWFLELYSNYPSWLDKEIEEKQIDLYLLCDTDLPWIKDKARENGGEKRIYLHNRYMNELEKLRLPYKIIRGQEENRLRMAVNTINSYF